VRETALLDLLIVFVLLPLRVLGALVIVYDGAPLALMRAVVFFWVSGG